MMRYICIHGHFYQPPRANPWLESVPLQPSAAPYHDWNERVTAECYAPNTAARILDASGRIQDIVNNYASMSFNMGPTLLTWLEQHAPQVYQAILTADRHSQAHFSGHGSALAQAYHHIILPLARTRDIETQIRWGIADFEHRFGRYPEGMWLPETAVHVATLEMLAACGIRFTILAPSQARRIRPLGSAIWQDVAAASLDTSMAYRCDLPSGQHITLFFYHAAIAQAVAFDNVLSSGEHFAERLLQAFDTATTRPQLVHIATDGETYGHHHRYGDMALAYALQLLRHRTDVRLTNYGEFLQRHPPTHAVEIIDNTSWSCAHGVERWRSHCGCSTGGQPGWHQTWRAPLRQALDGLRDRLASLYTEHGQRYFHDPWAARNAYIQLLLDPSPEQRQQFFQQQAPHGLPAAACSTALQLLEMQRHAMLMYTSCGWFFAEVSGLETVQILQYAMRAMELARPFADADLELDFVTQLAAAPSNRPEYRHAHDVYEHLVRAHQVNHQTLGREYAARLLFTPPQEWLQFASYTVRPEVSQRVTLEHRRWVSGRITLTARATCMPTVVHVAALYLGTHQVYGGVWDEHASDVFTAFLHAAPAVLEHGDTTAVQALLNSHGAAPFTFHSLSRDTQNLLARAMLRAHLADTEAACRHLHALYTTLMPYVLPFDNPLPGVLPATTAILLNLELRHACADEQLDAARIRTLLTHSQQAGVGLDLPTLSAVLKHTLEHLATQLSHTPMDLSLLQRLESGVVLGRQAPFQIDCWILQNIYYALLQDLYPRLRAQADQSDRSAQTWVQHFQRLGNALAMRIGDLS